MKNLFVIVFLFLGTLAQAQLTSKEEVAPELVAKREAQKKEITSNYLALKNSLVISDSISVVKNAVALKQSLNNFKFKKLSLEQMNEATTKRKELIDLTAEVAATKNINKQRAIVQSLSAKFWDLAPKFKAVDSALYLQVCPMTSAMWLSDSKEIKNPYYPKNMLTCGEVKASL
jgi:Cu(I)/Ag(I) efflux system membrane fusion protein